MMIHKRQLFDVDCGAASLAMICNCTVLEAIQLAGTDKDGTKTHNVMVALRNKGFNTTLIDLGGVDFREYSNILSLNSIGRKLYLGCIYHDKTAKNGTARRHHAIAVSNGLVYDPAEKSECPIEAYHPHNKKLVIESMIIVE